MDFSIAFLITFTSVKKICAFALLLCASAAALGQENPLNNPVQTPDGLRINDLLEKKAEYHRITNGEQDGYRIKIHFGVDREEAENTRTKFATRFSDFITYLEYQQPNFVVLVGDFRSKLEAFESLKKIQIEFPNAFIVKDRINTK